MRVVVTRPAAECEGWVCELRRRGFDAVALPLIEIRPAARTQDLADAWRLLPSQRAAMFVSANAVREFFAQSAGAQWPAAVRAWATGNGTRNALVEAGVPASAVDMPPEHSAQFDSEALWRQVAAQVRPGDSVLIVRGGDAATGQAAGRDWLAGQLANTGARVQVVVAYLRDLPEWTEHQRQLAFECADGATWLFSSSQAISQLRTLLPGQDWAGADAVATHPRIAQAARDATFGVVCESRPAMDDVVAALESLR